jgi:hypothetical protein
MIVTIFGGPNDGDTKEIPDGSTEFTFLDLPKKITVSGPFDLKPVAWRVMKKTHHDKSHAYAVLVDPRLEKWIRDWLQIQKKPQE